MNRNREDKFYTSFNEKLNREKEYSHFIWSHISRDGVLWISDWDNGIYRMDPFHKEIPQYDVGNIVISLLEDDSGKLWLGTAGNGLFVCDAARDIQNKV
jgi:ligand-binding sensor domain-containing protein